MNADSRSDQRLIAELAESLPVPAERDLPAGRQETLKEHLMTELRQAHHSGVRRQRPGGRPRLIALAATATAAVVAATALTLATLAGHHGPSAPGHPAGPGTAAQLLAKIAAAAARQPSLSVRDDQYMYISSDDGYGVSSVTVHGKVGKVTSQGEHTSVEPIHKREIWLSVSDVCKPGLLIDPSPGPAIKLTGGIFGRCPNRGGFNDPTYRFLQSLPADPHTLLNMIYAATKGAGQSPDQEAFTTIGDMLREAVAPPAISAALYRAAALIPGVRVIRHVTDILGHSGIGVQFARRVIQSPAPGVPYREVFDPNGTTWIFSPRTLLWVGENDGTLHGKTMGSVVLRRAIVDRLGQRP
jgi:hypothetical protein